MKKRNTLIDKLNNLTSLLDDAEMDNYKLLLGLAAGGLAPTGDVPEEDSKPDAFETVLNCLSHIQPSGIVWRGRPDFMNDDLLLRLQQEAIERRESAIFHDHDQYYLGCGGPIANELAKSKDFLDLVSNKSGKGMTATGIASYIYYESEGCGLPPHVDTQTFTMNAILMLSHEYDHAQSPSHLLVYPVNAPAQRILLEPGDLFLFFAGGTIHGREYLKKDEVVNILTFGFLPTK